jgi:hypothetical protein
MNKENIIYRNLTFSASLLIFFCFVVLITGCSPQKEEFSLSVRVLHIVDGRPISAGTVKIISIENNSIVSQQKVNKNGEVLFHLPEGHYLISMKSGFVGSRKIELNEDRNIVLSVIQILQ